MRRQITTWLAFSIAALGLVGPATAAQNVSYHPYRGLNEIRVRGGLFAPDGDSRYWEEKEFDFFTTADDFEDFLLGVDYRRRLGPRTALVFSGTAYSAEESTSYRDFVDENGGDIFHDTTLDIASGTVGVHFILTGADAPVQPYIGAGVGFWAWSLEESGDFIDFSQFNPEIFTDTFTDDGAAFGWYYLFGVDVPLGDQFSLLLEARWDRVDDELAGDFRGLGDLDLSGRQVTGGLAIRF
ncbi:MAG: outer membrane beta-barrel protein [Thermoanaerobaculia bacterium]